VSVDTYLARKNVSGYQRLREADLQVLVAPMLSRQAATLRVNVGRFLFWRSLRVEAEPREDHFHGPTCRH